MKTVAEIEITTEGILRNGSRMETTGTGSELLNNAYRHYVNDYPKFFKMDGLSKLGFLASELLLQQLDEERFVPREDRAVVLFNRSGSIEADRHYQSTISDADNFFPSPSVFVYTLPNIVTGEIAIRHQIQGETSFYILDTPEQLEQILPSQITNHKSPILCGWCECSEQNTFYAKIQIIWNN